MPRRDIPPGWDERTTLTTFLDYVAPPSTPSASTSPRTTPARPASRSPLMTLAGLVNHLRWVEYYWFQVMLLGEEDHGPWTEDPNREMRIAVAVPIAQLLDEYEAHAHATGTWSPPWIWTPVQAACRWSARHAALDPVPSGRGTARHNGHLDILRELADGVTRDLTGRRRQDLGEPPLDNGLQLLGTDRPNQTDAPPRAKGARRLLRSWASRWARCASASPPAVRLSGQRWMGRRLGSGQAAAVLAGVFGGGGGQPAIGSR